MPATPSRMERLRRLAGRHGSAGLKTGCDALLVTHLPNVLYLTGFRGSSGVLAVTQETALLFVPALYRTQARQEATEIELRVDPDPLRGATRWLRSRRARRIAYEDLHLSLAQFELVRAELGPRATLQAGGRWVEQLRATKEPAEIACIRASQALTARVFEEVLPLVRPGALERDLAAEIEFRLKRHGAQKPAFDTIVASGPRAALPHGRAGGKRLKQNELVIFDMGAILSDYHSDMTRTVFLGDPPARVKQVHRAVQQALERARARVRAGVAARAVDAAARRLLEQEGLGRFFIHGTGHGLGLEIHEDPRVARTSDARLAAGNVITLEPGVYIPGWGGVRIEDVVVVGRRGAETLTPLSTELLCL
ncbi:MAG: M24 family metallopeptidase [Candidatus Acidiferrales bacterium]